MSLLKYKDPVTGDWMPAGIGMGGFGGHAANTVHKYGAKGNGVTDDTDAFRAALAAERTVFVPGGTYILSDTLTIEENCELELAQSAVLKFVQTDRHCIAMQRSASIRGHHATVSVPYTFSADVIHASNDVDADISDSDAVPPFTRWDPQWKMTRYITDINICKPDSRGFHYSVDGDTYGTALDISCIRNDNLASYMWGVNMSGVRIAGGFTYGIRIHNTGTAWNHDMRIEAVIDGCETGASIENCNNAHLAVTIQPRPALKSDGVTSVPYAKYGIKLTDSKNIDLSQSAVWDWIAANTLCDTSPEYQHISMYGNCRGTILGDFTYNEDSTDIRSRIYTDTPANFDSLIILQEPFTRYFKPVSNEPYFDNGGGEKRLALKQDIDEYFETQRVAKFTDVLSAATDASGAVFNGIGYKPYGCRIGSDGKESNEIYYGATGFIPCAPGDTLYADGLSWAHADGWCRVAFYDADKNMVVQITAANVTGGSQYFATYAETENGFSLLVNPVPELADVAYIRICLHRSDFGAAPVVSLNNEVRFAQEGFVADGIKVKGASLILTSPGGKSFVLTVGEDGGLSAEEIT